MESLKVFGPLDRMVTENSREMEEEEEEEEEEVHCLPLSLGFHLR